MTTKSPDPQSLQPLADHPLAKIAGKHSGEVWDNTLEEIRQNRQRDREQLHRESSLLSQ